jgi:hypothetical protein
VPNRVGLLNGRDMGLKVIPVKIIQDGENGTVPVRPAFNFKIVGLCPPLPDKIIGKVKPARIVRNAVKFY